MDKTVLRNFQKHLLPLAGTGPLTCLQLGVRNPGHAVWLLENVLACTDDAWYGTDDFRGSEKLFRKALDALGAFTNATLWPFAERDFLRLPPPKCLPRLQKGAALLYLDGTREPTPFSQVLTHAWHYLRPDGLLVVNGYRTRRRREAEVHDIVDEFLGWPTVEAERVWHNTQIGVRRI